MGEHWTALPLIASGLCAALLHLTRSSHGRWTADHLSGVQKLHEGQPPRVGLLPIFAGALIGTVALYMQATEADTGAEAPTLLALLLLCGLPAALMGLLEDVTKQVRARWRLLAPAVGVLLAAGSLHAVIPRVGIPWVDEWVAWGPVSLAVTLLMVVGFTHAMNIVDGLNGLASGLAVLMLAATGWVAHRLGDVALAQVCWVLALSVLGFMLLNFPRGLVFLGDGGAYFLGFTLALIWVLLLVRHPDGASPWFVMAVAFHATMETIFSIVRRKTRRRPKNATAPDRLHFHTLVLRRRVRSRVHRLAVRWVGKAGRSPWVPNAVASSVVLACAALPMLLAVAQPAKDAWGFTVFVCSVFLYLLAYTHVVRFGWRRRRVDTHRPSMRARAHGSVAANDSVAPVSEPARANRSL